MIFLSCTMKERKWLLATLLPPFSSCIWEWEEEEEEEALCAKILAQQLFSSPPLCPIGLSRKSTSRDKESVVQKRKKKVGGRERERQHLLFQENCKDIHSY